MSKYLSVHVAEFSYNSSKRIFEQTIDIYEMTIRWSYIWGQESLYSSKGQAVFNILGFIAKSATSHSTSDWEGIFPRFYGYTNDRPSLVWILH